MAISLLMMWLNKMRCFVGVLPLYLERKSFWARESLSQRTSFYKRGLEFGCVCPWRFVCACSPPAPLDKALIARTLASLPLPQHARLPSSFAHARHPFLSRRTLAARFFLGFRVHLPSSPWSPVA
jgi:hypothetical protein